MGAEGIEQKIRTNFEPFSVDSGADFGDFRTTRYFEFKKSREAGIEPAFQLLG